MSRAGDRFMLTTSEIELIAKLEQAADAASFQHWMEKARQLSPCSEALKSELRYVARVARLRLPHDDLERLVETHKVIQDSTSASRSI